MNRKKVLSTAAYILIAVCFLLAFFAMPTFKKGANFGIWSLMPPVMMFIFVLLTQHLIEGFFWAAMLSVVMRYKGATMTGFVDEVFTAITNWDNFWILWLFMLGGAITFLFRLSGAGTYFARWTAKHIKSRKAAMLVMALMGFPLCIDDYMSSLVTGSVFTPIMDNYKVPREMTVYIIRCFATIPAVLLPIGAWSIYVGGVFKMTKVNIFKAYGTGLHYFMVKVLPYLFFPFLCIIVCLLVILGVIPLFGKMKKAFQRVEEGGSFAPPVQARIIDGVEEVVEEDPIPEPRAKVNLSHFFVPVIAIIGFGYIFNWDMAYGIAWGLLVSFLYYVVTGVFDLIDCKDVICQGFGYMSEMLVLMALALIIVGNLNKMGYVQFIVESISGMVTPKMLPLIIFVIFSITESMVTFNYTLYLIAMPVVVPLAQNCGANVPLCIAALVSTGLVGYMLAFSSDGGILACAAAGKIDLYQQNLAQYPYHIIAWVLAAILYLVFGMIG